MDFNSVDKQDYNKYTFGNCLRQQRCESGCSLRELSREIGISPAYLSDIENGNRYAPLNSSILQKIIQRLHIPTEQLDAFYDMAFSSKGYLAFKDYLEQDKNAIFFLRYAQELELSADEWKFMFEQLEGLKKERKNKTKKLSRNRV